MPNIENVGATRLSAEARTRLSAQDRGALFLANWVDTVFIHYTIDPAILQPHVPFRLDVRDGKAYISLVAFTLNRMRFACAENIGRILLRPISDHQFLNVRTYVREGRETGIYFLAEWLNNRLAVPLGPRSFGLPYNYGTICYQHTGNRGLEGSVIGNPRTDALHYEGELSKGGPLEPVLADTLEEFLLERYTAFTFDGKRARFFRIWHEPWPQRPANVRVTCDTLLRNRFPLFAHARVIGANYSPGVHDVWMGFPHQMEAPEKHHRLNTFFRMP